MAKDCRGNTVVAGDALSLWNDRDAPVPPPDGEVLAVVRGEVVVGYAGVRATRIAAEKFADFNWVKWLGDADANAWDAHVAALAEAREREEAEALARIPAENLAISPEDFE